MKIKFPTNTLILIGLIILIYATSLNTIVLFQYCKNIRLKPDDSSIECQIKSGKFYYHPNCGWCQRQIDEGNLEELEGMGISLERIDVSKGNYSFLRGTPAWIVNEKLSYGYKNLEDLKLLFLCS